MIIENMRDKNVILVSVVAGYICQQCYERFHEKISEMKLHKLLYFAQRESIIQNGQPLFDAVFYGWVYGPVVREIRDLYEVGFLPKTFSNDDVRNMQSVIYETLSRYGGKDAWSLSRLSHGELSWKNARIGLGDGECGDIPLKLSDIILDAERVKLRRMQLRQAGIRC